MRYFKVVPPEEFSYKYVITLKSNEDKYIIGTHRLDAQNKDDAFQLYLMQKLDNKSIIEFYGKQFKVKDWNIDNINKEIEIYV